MDCDNCLSLTPLEEQLKTLSSDGKTSCPRKKTGPKPDQTGPKPSGQPKKNAPKQPNPPTSKPQLTYADLPHVKTIDIGANLVSGCYSGYYHSSEQKHPADIEAVLARAVNSGLSKIMLTSCSLSDTKKSLKLVRQYPGLLSTTIGFHPTHTCEIAAIEKKGGPAAVEALEKEMLQIALQGKKDGTIVAIGECGLDFHPQRMKFSSMETQLKYFPMHLRLAKATGLPLFLHNRDSAEDMVRILTEHQDCISQAVVHSFDGGQEVMEKLFAISPNIYIGLNGCSLREPAMLECAKNMPLDKIMIETDCPYCEIKNTHPGIQYVKTKWPKTKNNKYTPNIEPMIDPSNPASQLFKPNTGEEQVFVQRKELPLSSLVDGRLEPCHIIQVLEVLSGVRNEDLVVLSEKIYENTMKVFFPTAV